MNTHRKRLSTAALAAGALFCTCAAVVALAACGGGNGSSSSNTAGSSSTTTAAGGSPGGAGAVVARVGSFAVSRGLLSEWMTEMLGEDFYAVAGERVPLGLVSEPENLPACVETAKAFVSARGSKAVSGQPSEGALSRKCGQLYEMIKAQALGYLVSSFWDLNFNAKYGLRVSEAEIQRSLRAIRTVQYPGAEFGRVLAERRRSLTQELFLIRNDRLQAKVLHMLRAGGTKAAAAFTARAERVANNANCSPGYIVEHCQGYVEAKEPKPRPAPSAASSPVGLLAEITG